MVASINTHECSTFYPHFFLGNWILMVNCIISQYLTLQLKSAGFTTFETNLLTIPAYAIFIINLLVLTWLSEKLNERFVLASFSQVWCLPLLIALELLPRTRNHWVTWALSMLLYAEPYAHAIIVAITSRNAGTVRTRTVASALYNISVQLSNIIGSNVNFFQRRALTQQLIR